METSIDAPRFAARLSGLAFSGGKRPNDLVFTMPGGSVMRLSNWRHATFKTRLTAGFTAPGTVSPLMHLAARITKS